MAHDGTGGWRHPPYLTESPLGLRPQRRQQFVVAQSSMASDSSVDDLRRSMRRQRAALAPAVRTHLAARIAVQLRRMHLLTPGKRVGVYLPFRGEVDIHPIIAWARRVGCELYVPRIVSRRSSHMQFVRFGERHPLKRGAFGIHEPAGNADELEPLQLDLVLVPLVAFDSHGTRMGMGAGFYDRAFARLAGARRWRKPKLIGIAYEFQRVQQLERRPWDVALDAAVTDRGLYRFDPSGNFIRGDQE